MVNSMTIEQRRKKVQEMLVMCMKEDDIAKELGVGQTTISRDVRALKARAQKWVYELAKSELAYEYRKSIASIERVQQEAQKMYDGNVSMRVKLPALKLIKDCEVSKFELLQSGPQVLNQITLESRISRIEKSQQSHQQGHIDR